MMVRYNFCIAKITHHRRNWLWLCIAITVFCTTTPGYHQQLFDAAQTGDAVAAKEALEKRTLLVMARDHNNFTPLHIAARNGHNNVVHVLLEYNAAVDDLDRQCYTPLHQAAQFGHSPVINTFIHHLKKLYHESPSTPVSNHVVIVNYLHREDTHGVTALHLAASYGHTHATRVLLGLGANTDAHTNLGCTPLHYAACHKNNNAVLRLLTRNGATLDARDFEGHTALHYAASRGNIKALRFLVRHSAVDINTQDRYGRTALHFLARNGDLCGIRVALKLGAQVNAITTGDSAPLLGITPLIEAARKDHLEAMQLLLDHNATINDHYPPLPTVAANGRLNAIIFLLKSGALIDPAGQGGWTALHKAIDKGFPNVTELLLRNGASVTVQDDNGRTPLFLAASLGYAQDVKLLIFYRSYIINTNSATQEQRVIEGAEIPNEYGRTAYYVACESVKQLLEDPEKTYREVCKEKLKELCGAQPVATWLLNRELGKK